MIPYAARSFTEPPGFMNSAFPRISHPVSSDNRLSRINGVLPTYPSMPEYLASILILVPRPLPILMLVLDFFQHLTLRVLDSAYLRARKPGEGQSIRDSSISLGMTD
jgi:hypothetical protein